jgi:nucleotide-binding universal stress UspA family protein
MGQGRVLVAVRDKEQVDDLVKLGCQLAKGTEAEIVAVSVAEIGASLPLDADDPVLDQQAREALERAAQVASECSGLKARTRLVRAREAGPALVDEAAEQNADHLVLGYHRRHGIIGEILLGSCVHFVINHAPCRVIIEAIPHDAAAPA